VVQVEHMQEMAAATEEPAELVQPAVLQVAVVPGDTLVPVAKVEEVMIAHRMQALPALVAAVAAVQWDHQAPVVVVVAELASLAKAQMV
jgi:hypothetical protein